MPLKGIGASYRGDDDSSSESSDSDGATGAQSTHAAKKRKLQLSYRPGAASDSDSDDGDRENENDEPADGRGSAEGNVGAGLGAARQAGVAGSPFDVMRGGRPSPMHAKITPKSSPYITKHESESQSPPPRSTVPEAGPVSFSRGATNVEVPRVTYDSYPFADTKLVLPQCVDEGCSDALVQKVASFIRLGREGNKVHKALASRKEFRNPIFYSSVVGGLDLDEFGSECDRQSYDPTQFEVHLIVKLKEQLKLRALRHQREQTIKQHQHHQQHGRKDPSKQTKAPHHVSNAAGPGLVHTAPALKPKALKSATAETMKKKALDIIAKKLKNLKNPAAASK